MNINWNDPKAKISRFFTVKEAIWLPEWNRLGNQPQDGLTDEVKKNLIQTFKWMDEIREWIGKPINVHLAFRSMAYHLDLYKRINEKRIKEGKKPLSVPMNSGHLHGVAVDFSVQGLSCDDVKRRILNEKILEKYNLRMEDNGWGANWIHLDSRPVGPSGRFFPIS